MLLKKSSCNEERLQQRIRTDFENSINFVSSQQYQDYNERKAVEGFIINNFIVFIQNEVHIYSQHLSVIDDHSRLELLINTAKQIQCNEILLKIQGDTQTLTQLYSIPSHIKIIQESNNINKWIEGFKSFTVKNFQARELYQRFSRKLITMMKMQLLKISVEMKIPVEQVQEQFNQYQLLISINKIQLRFQDENNCHFPQVNYGSIKCYVCNIQNYHPTKERIISNGLRKKIRKYYYCSACYLRLKVKVPLCIDHCFLKFHCNKDLYEIHQ